MISLGTYESIVLHLFKSWYDEDPIFSDFFHDDRRINPLRWIYADKYGIPKPSTISVENLALYLSEMLDSLHFFGGDQPYSIPFSRYMNDIMYNYHNPFWHWIPGKDKNMTEVMLYTMISYIIMMPVKGETSGYYFTYDDFDPSFFEKIIYS